MQNSQFFPGFFQNKFFFQQPQSYQISDRLKPRQTQEPSFIRDAQKRYGNHSEMQITEITIATSHSVFECFFATDEIK